MSLASLNVWWSRTNSLLKRKLQRFRKKRCAVFATAATLSPFVQNEELNYVSIRHPIEISIVISSAGVSIVADHYLMSSADVSIVADKYIPVNAFNDHSACFLPCAGCYTLDQNGRIWQMFFEIVKKITFSMFNLIPTRTLFMGVLAILCHFVKCPVDRNANSLCRLPAAIAR